MVETAQNQLHERFPFLASSIPTTEICAQVATGETDLQWQPVPAFPEESRNKNGVEHSCCKPLMLRLIGQFFVSLPRASVELRG